MFGFAQGGDERLLQSIRRRNGMSVNDILQSAGVTRTAVQQRLKRLLRQGLVQRHEVHQRRGRPFYEYALTERAERLFGTNYPDLAVSLWRQIKWIKDPTTRRELIRRVRDHMVAQYAERVCGDTCGERLEELKQVLAEQGIDVEIDRDGQFPILREHDCPYPKLAVADRGICALEKQVFTQLLGCGVKLTRCRLIGHGCACCEFEIRDRSASAS